MKIPEFSKATKIGDIKKMASKHKIYFAKRCVVMRKTEETPWNIYVREVKKWYMARNEFVSTLRQNDDTGFTLSQFQPIDEKYIMNDVNC